MFAWGFLSPQMQMQTYFLKRVVTASIYILRIHKSQSKYNLNQHSDKAKNYSTIT
jgi:hypothetical protein